MRRYRHLAIGLAAVLVAATAAGFGARPADAALAAHATARLSVSCWASTSGPTYVSGTVVASVTWQCTPGTQQQMAPYISLTAPNGTRYGAATQCFNTSVCSVSVSAPYSGGNWMARSDYMYVVDYSGTSSYVFGPAYYAYL